MENNKSKKVLGILSIIWGGLLLLYIILRNTVLSDWYTSAYMKESLIHGSEAAEQLKIGFEAFNNLITIAFFVALIVIVIFLIIYHKKRNIKLFSKEISNGTYFICFGLLFSFLIGTTNLVSLIFVSVGGILLICSKQ